MWQKNENKQTNRTKLRDKFASQCEKLKKKCEKEQIQTRMRYQNYLMI